MNKTNTPRRSRAMLGTLPITFSTSVHLPFRQQRTLTLRGPAVLISRNSSANPEEANKLIVLSNSTKPISVGKQNATLAGLKISFPDPQSRNAFLTAADTAIKRNSGGIDNYAICRELARGAVGVVLLVRRRSDGKMFAMKTIPKTDSFLSDSRLENLVTERTALVEAAQRRSPFIVRLVDAFETYERLCFVMELAEYGDLKGILDSVRRGRLSEGTARMLFAEALLGLEESHRMGYLFRDMKLGNLLVNRNGHVKVADYGLAKRMEVEYEGSSMSSESSSHSSDDEEPFRLVGRTTSFVGTRKYMSPEHLGGGASRTRGYGAPVDVWALGVTLYILLTGEYPFGQELYSRETAALFFAISNEELKFPWWVGKEARSLIQRMLDRDVLKRIGLNEIKEHAWMKGIDWTSIRYNAVKDVPQKEVLEEFRQNGVVIENEEEDMACCIERCSVECSVSCGSSSSGRRISKGGFRIIELVGFGHISFPQ